MAMRTRPPSLSILSIFLFSTLSLLSLSNALRDSEYEVLRCLDQCDDTDIYKYLMCQKECELEYRRREDVEEPMRTRELDPRWRQPRGGRGGEGEAVSPQRKYEECRRSCWYEEEEEEGEECEERCEELLRARQRKRDWEREREVDGGKNELSPALKLIEIKKDKPEENEDCNGKQQRERAQHMDGVHDRELEKKLEECRKRCERYRQGQERQLCKFRCMQRSQREAERERSHSINRNGMEYPFREQERQSGYDNPYYFNSQRFKTWFRSENVGQFRVLEKFPKRSKLLRPIANYRLAIFEAEYNTFVLPHYDDADRILLVLKGKVTINLITQGKRESYAFERGDVFGVPAGTTIYIINAECEQVQIAMLINPINTPSKFQEFFPIAKSYYSVFSSEFLETALNTTIDQLQKLFARQRQDAVIRAPAEVLRELSQTRSSNKKKSHDHGSKGRGPFNLLSQKPIYCNKFGRFFQAAPEKFKQLPDTTIAITHVELKQGSMLLPHFNSRMMTVVLVAEGNGAFEMACPHVQKQTREYRETEWETEEQQEEEGHYRKVSSELSPGDVFVIPPGHPIIIFASLNQKLRMVGFGINAENNQRIFLAGKESIMEQIKNEAAELVFDVPAWEIDGVFKNQDESYFVSSQPDCGPSEEEDECKKSLEAS